MKANYADARSILRILSKHGHASYLAGGCVRDLLLGLNPNDFDVATAAKPEEVQLICESEGIKTVPVGASFGVIKVVVDGRELDVASFRIDGDYTDHRRPDTITHTTSAEEDVKRRDFTINSMLMDDKEQIYDYVGGQQDLRNRILRCVGNPISRFTEDALRMMRAIRFAVRFDLKIDPETWVAIESLRETIKNVSTERVTDELTKTFSYGNCDTAYWLLRKSGLWHKWFGIAPDDDDSFRALFGLAKIQPGDPFTLALAIILCEAYCSTRSPHIDKLALTNAQKSEYKEILDKSVKLTSFATSTLAQQRVMRNWEDFDLIKKFLAYQDHIRTYRYAAAPNEDILVMFEQVKSLGYPNPLINGNDLLEMGFIQGPVFGDILKEVRTAQLSQQLEDKSKVKDFIIKTFPGAARKLADGTIQDGMSPVLMVASCKCGVTLSFKVSSFANGQPNWSSITDVIGLRNTYGYYYECKQCYTRKAKTSFVKASI